MRKTLATVGFAALVSAAPALAPTAEADHLWIAAGAGFHVGGLAFSVVLGDAPYGPPVHYWRTVHPLSYRGHRCSDACFFDHGVYYHAASCPLVHRHFHRYGYDPHAVYVRWAPRYRYDSHRYGSGHRSYRYDRGYHRHDRRRDHRFDRRHRHDDRRHDRRWDRDRRHRGDHHRYDRRRGGDRDDDDRDDDRRRGRRRAIPDDRDDG
jgi:hypothetical protein